MELFTEKNLNIANQIPLNLLDNASKDQYWGTNAQKIRAVDSQPFINQLQLAVKIPIDIQHLLEDTNKRLYVSLENYTKRQEITYLPLLTFLINNFDSGNLAQWLSGYLHGLDPFQVNIKGVRYNYKEKSSKCDILFAINGLGNIKKLLNQLLKPETFSFYSMVKKVVREDFNTIKIAEDLNSNEISSLNELLPTDEYDRFFDVSRISLLQSNPTDNTTQVVREFAL